MDAIAMGKLLGSVDTALIHENPADVLTVIGEHLKPLLLKDGFILEIYLGEVEEISSD